MLYFIGLIWLYIVSIAKPNLNVSIGFCFPDSLQQLPSFLLIFSDVFWGVFLAIFVFIKQFLYEGCAA